MSLIQEKDSTVKIYEKKMGSKEEREVLRDLNRQESKVSALAQGVSRTKLIRTLQGQLAP